MYFNVVEVSDNYTKVYFQEYVMDEETITLDDINEVLIKEGIAFQAKEIAFGMMNIANCVYSESKAPQLNWSWNKAELTADSATLNVMLILK